MIPFFSLFVKDIYFLNEGCANRSESGSINFEVSHEPIQRGGGGGGGSVVNLSKIYISSMKAAPTDLKVEVSILR